MSPSDLRCKTSMKYLTLGTKGSMGSRLGVSRPMVIGTEGSMGLRLEACDLGSEADLYQ